MQITEIIPTIAELAVTVAGFSAVVVALRRKPVRDWNALDRFHLRVLLQVAALTVIFCIFPFGALVVFEPETAWKVSLLVYGFVHLIDLASFGFNLPEDMIPINKVSIGIGTAMALAQIAIGFTGEMATIQLMYLVTLLWHLATSCLGFARLIYTQVGSGRS